MAYACCALGVVRDHNSPARCLQDRARGWPPTCCVAGSAGRQRHRRRRAASRDSRDSRAQDRSSSLRSALIDAERVDDECSARTLTTRAGTQEDHVHWTRREQPRRVRRREQRSSCQRRTPIRGDASGGRGQAIQREYSRGVKCQCPRSSRPAGTQRKRVDASDGPKQRPQGRHGAVCGPWRGGAPLRCRSCNPGRRSDAVSICSRGESSVGAAGKGRDRRGVMVGSNGTRMRARPSTRTSGDGRSGRVPSLTTSGPDATMGRRRRSQGRAVSRGTTCAGAHLRARHGRCGGGRSASCVDQSASRERGRT